MKIDIQNKKNIENDKSSVQIKSEDNDVLMAANMPFSQMLSQQLSDVEIEANASNNLYALSVDYNYDSLSMDFNDAIFFVNLAQEGQFSIENASNGDFSSIVKTELTQNVITQKTVDVTNQLTSLIEKAQKTQKPVRITFDNDVSVIIKIDKHGKVSAEFIPGSLEVENYLRNNIASLRQKFDEQNLPYNDLFYRQNNAKQNRNKDKRKGEQ